MYNNNTQPDPFAGQYPPPPPLASSTVEHPTNNSDSNNQHLSFQQPISASAYTQQPTTSTPPVGPYSPPLQQEHVYMPLPIHQDQTYIPSLPSQEQSHNLSQEEAYLPPQAQYHLSYPPQEQSHNLSQEEVYLPPPPPPPQTQYHLSYPPQEAYPTFQNDYYNNAPTDQYNGRYSVTSPPAGQYENSTSAHYSIPPPNQQYNTQHRYKDEEDYAQGRNDTDASLKSRLERERQEERLHNAPHEEEEEEDISELEKVPIIATEENAERPDRKERKRLEKAEKNKRKSDYYQPHFANPTVAPANEAETYRPSPQYREQDKSCNCCCYNPAITCCSFFMLLVSFAFAAAGIAMIIASKVISDKCTNQCSSVVEQAQSACTTICSKVLHDGLFYGGIVVAGLAGIAIIWKLIMWTCAGYSKR